MLERIFIRNHKETDRADVRHSYGNLAGFLGIVSNFILGTVKLFIGVLSNSVSIMADAANNIADMATSIITIIGFKLSAKKPDSKHPYGHARYEYVCAFVISLFMFVMGVFFAKESIIKIFNPEELAINRETYIILSLAVLVKLFQFAEYRIYAKATKSQAIEATSTDTRNDIITTTGILVSMVIMGIFKINIDGYVGLAVSVLVIISATGAIREGLEPIIGIVPTKEQVKEISDKIKGYPVVLGIHDMLIHNYGVHNDFVTVHVEVDACKNISEVHDAIDNIEADFKHELGIQLTIHMDPVEIGNPEIEGYRQQVGLLLKKLDSRLQFHDFRMVKGQTHTNLIFDCVVPQDKDWNSEFFASYLKKNVISSENLFFVVEIDRPYC